MRYMLLPFRRFFDFQGRSRRMEFWMFVLFNVVAWIVFMMIFVALFMGRMIDLARAQGGYESYQRYSSNGFGYETGFSAEIPPHLVLEAIGPLGIAMFGIMSLYGLIALIPNIAVTIRRLHDTDRSGWWLAWPYGAYLVVWALSLSAVVSPETSLASVIVVLLAWVAGLIGGLVLLVFLFLDGTRGPNRFGADPKGPDISHTFA